MTMILHVLFKQYSICTKSSFAHYDCNQLHNKSIFVNYFINTPGKHSYLGSLFCVKTSFRYDVNQHVFLKCSIKFAFISNFFDKIRETGNGE